MVVGYQKGITRAFTSVKSINGPYVDGVSITHGNPRKHLWTYAIGLSDRSNVNDHNCPCSVFPGRSPPSFVHENYYCESGTLYTGSRERYFTGDPVWDGNGCSRTNNCCADPSLPWFYRQIPLIASGDIETRICCDGHASNRDVLVREIQLYVQ